MAELNDLNENDASNTARFPNGMQVAALSDGARALEGLLGRDNKDRNGSLATGGTATAYTITPFRTITAIAAGLSFTVRAHIACTTVGTSPFHVTLDVASLGARPLTRQNGAPLRTGDIVQHQILHIVYSSGLDSWVCVGIGDSDASNGIPAFPKASLPAVTDTRLIYVTDEAGGPVPAYSDGTNWRRVTDRAVVS